MVFLLRLTLLSLLALAGLAAAEPVQYCRTGYSEGQADFCVAIATYHNTSTDAWDIYLAMTVTRSSALGWTAIGTGPGMAGSLMFIIYGDPTLAGVDPVLSIRTVAGHHQPYVLNDTTRAQVLPAGASLRVLHSKWQPLPSPPSRRHNDDPNYPIKPSSPATHLASIAVACHGCGHPSLLAPSSNSHPFIWAWNDRQRFETFPLDAHLAMHRHRSSGGGFGTFYVDMARSHAIYANVESPPTIQPGVARLGTSDGPIGVGGFFSALRDRPLPKAHGALMGVAFLVLFPLGVILMRMPTARGSPFARHWKVQAVASAAAWLGAAVAAVMTGGKMPRTPHQWIGVAVAVLLALQGLLGWRHHVGFLRTGRRTWVSNGHIWLGRGVLAVGWLNVISGMILSGQGWLSVAVVAGLVLMELIGVSLWVWNAKKREARLAGPVEGHALMPRDGEEDYFVLDMSDDEFGSEGQSGDEAKSKRRGKRKGGSIDGATKN